MPARWSETVKAAAIAGKYLSSISVNKRPISVVLEVTKRCNARCPFCFYWKTPEERAKGEMKDFSPVFDVFDPIVVSITGGEPLMREDLVEVISNLRKKKPHLYISMISNMILMDMEKARELRKAGVDQLTISIDGMGDAHDKSRGHPGLFNKIMAMVPQLKQLGFHAISFHCIIMKQTLDEIVNIAQMSADMGVNASFSCYCELKTGSKSRHLEDKDLRRIEHVVESLKELKKKYHHIRSSDWYLENIPEFWRNNAEMTGCKAGSRWVTVTPEGYVKPCSELDVMCHYTEWSKHFQIPEEVSQCSKCWYSCRGEAQTPFSVKRMVDLVRTA